VTLGDVIKTHRQLRNLTQENVADALRTTAATVGRWESNRHRPHSRHLRALAGLFDVDPQDLVRPVRPALARALLSERRRELLAESPGLLAVERDPFGWRLRQVLGWRELDVWTFARRLGISDRTARRWLAGAVVPAWEELWRVAELLDVPVWWWRCGGDDEQAMYGPYDLAGPASGQPPDARSGWQFASQVARRLDAPVEDIVRTAYPGWAGWRLRNGLGGWAPTAAPSCPVPARLRRAVLDHCANGGGDVHDATQWLADVCEVTTTTVTRWLDGERTPRWEKACRAAMAIGKPAWWFWLPADEVPVVRAA
jgi:transcriptional regulator with XRE-family HTH domain